MRNLLKRTLTKVALLLALLVVAPVPQADAGGANWEVGDSWKNGDGDWVTEIKDDDGNNAYVTRGSKRKSRNDAQTVCDAANLDEGCVDPCIYLPDGCVPGL